MKITTVKFNGINYQVSTGDIFQAKIDNSIKGQIFIVYGDNNEKVTLEIVEKISNKLALIRVNNIEWEEKDIIKKEDYEDVIKEPDLNEKSISDMTKKELINFAEEHGLDINKKAVKSKLLEEIKNYYQ